ncbi:MAG: DMT family transporter [Candidatus Devosia phytovorans]|uniref:DMT family transporter n=1 Tax=Candidatus Devosia phytovorans TaxID=3121372 RepID=A0AAJ5VWL5_9HYPH|nr:DMT family transporter [Devosia sp.]WEK05265.1 MAG: DMT family transporter [Devosia sp.]
MSGPDAHRPNPLHLLAAFASGSLLTMMVFLNGEAGRHGGSLFASWLAHGTGTVAAILLLALLWPRLKTSNAPVVGKAPLWAYFGGLSGAATVMLTSTTVNTPLALGGTLALGLAGQVVFGLAADQWGLFGLPKRRLGLRDAGAVALIAAGSLLIILFGLGGVA